MIIEALSSSLSAGPFIPIKHGDSASSEVLSCQSQTHDSRSAGKIARQKFERSQPLTDAFSHRPILSTSTANVMIHQLTPR